jgi:hypothetical protein
MEGYPEDFLYHYREYSKSGGTGPARGMISALGPGDTWRRIFAATGVVSKVLSSRDELRSHPIRRVDGAGNEDPMNDLADSRRVALQEWADIQLPWWDEEGHD